MANPHKKHKSPAPHYRKANAGKPQRPNPMPQRGQRAEPAPEAADTGPPCRWLVRATLTLLTPLHVGSGGEDKHDELSDDTPEVWVAAMLRDADRKPCIPGASVKGALRSLAERSGLATDFVRLVFGAVDGNRTVPGRVEFMTAFMCADPAQSRPSNPAEKDRYGLPNFDPGRREAVLPRTAVDRVTGSVIPGKLFHDAVVPPGARFELELACDGLSAAQVARLKWLLIVQTGREDAQFSLGAGATRGQGRLRCDTVETHRFGPGECTAWLNALVTDPKPWYRAGTAIDLPAQAPADMPGPRLVRVRIDLSFHTPFLVKQAGDKGRQQADAVARHNHEGKVVLPSSSWRGAMRAHCERILRTLGAEVAHGHDAPLYRKGEPFADLAGALFGVPGWKGVLSATDFKVGAATASRRQEMVAIDRLTGGGKDSAKFNVDYVECPTLTGTLTLDLGRLQQATLRTAPPGAGGSMGSATVCQAQAALGLLLLAMRDLEEGDIGFGHGRAKGYGQCKAHEALHRWQVAFRTAGNPWAATEQSLSALRALHPASAAIAPAIVRGPGRDEATHRPEGEALMRPVHATQTNRFHNPYAFIPFAKPDPGAWPDMKQLCGSAHAHDRYSGLCGRLVCRLTARTPIFVGAGQMQVAGLPTAVDAFRLDGEIALPATSLRGMISSLFESVSASNVRVMHDAPMSMRKRADQALSAMGRIVRCGEAWYLDPLHTQVEPRRRSFDGDPGAYDIRQWYYMRCPPEAQPITQAQWNMLESDAERTQYVRGFVRTLNVEGRQFPKTVLHLHFVPCPEASGAPGDSEAGLLKIPPAVVEHFHALADQALDRMNGKPKDTRTELLTPYVPKGRIADDRNEKLKYRTRLRAGDLMYFGTDGRGCINELSFSAVWRQGPAQDGRHWTTDRFLEESHPDLLPLGRKRSDGSTRTALSPAELLFGVVEDKGLREDTNPRLDRQAFAFASKVRIGHGVLLKEGAKEVELLPLVKLKELSSPKPPSPALYFSPHNGAIGVSKRALADNPAAYRLNGRKAYLHGRRDADGNVLKLDDNGYSHNHGEVPWKSRQRAGDDGDTRRMAIQPLPARTVFHFEVDFHNLDQAELEQLCAALHPSDRFEHKLGLGKPIGLGSVKVEPVGLFIVDRLSRYALDPIGASRYAQAWRAEGLTSQAAQAQWPHRFGREAFARGRVGHDGQPAHPCPSPLDLAAAAMARVDRNVVRALQLLGDPSSATAPVHYPQMANCHLEDKTYQWTVHNDGQRPGMQQALGRIEADSPALPTLRRPAQ